MEELLKLLDELEKKLISAKEAENDLDRLYYTWRIHTLTDLKLALEGK